MKNKIIFGCVADDFTGASDVASFLVKGGLSTLLYNGIPKEEPETESGAVVIALKTRTQETPSAVEDTVQAVKWLKNHGVKQIFMKYCSTFDSTRTGNIGPILDRLLGEYGEKYTILCPALPVNGRVVREGNLYVNGVPLHESPMRNHPLTPMWDSDIAVLMEPQSGYPCMKLNKEKMYLPDKEIFRQIEAFGADKEHFYVIPDYETEEDARRILALFGDLPILSGGSGLMEKIGEKYADMVKAQKGQIPQTEETGRGIIFAGSCSKATLGQIAHFQQAGGKSVKIEPEKLLSGEQTPDSIWESVLKNPQEQILLYSSDEKEKVAKIQQEGKEKIAALLEDTIAGLAKRAAEEGYTRIIVAGGETSGAVTKRLGFDSYYIGRSVAPGVPVMIPVQDTRIRLVLKSGNFGQKDFFERALRMTEENAEVW